MGQDDGGEPSLGKAFKEKVFRGAGSDQLCSVPLAEQVKQGPRPDFRA